MLQAKTQDIIPESGLGPQNSQWRRWVETSITNLKLSLKAFRADIANSFKAVSSSMQLLSTQVQLLSTQMLQNKSYYVFESDLDDLFEPYAPDYGAPIEGGSVDFVATGTQLLCTLTAVGTASSASNNAEWVYTVKIPGILLPVLVPTITPASNTIYQQNNLMGGSHYVRFSETINFRITVPTPGSYTITTQRQAYGNASDGTQLEISSALMEIRNL